MTIDNAIFEKLTEMARTLFDEYQGPWTPALRSEDVEQWDSLATVQFAVMVEQAFNIRFSTDEIVRLDNLGAIASIVAQKKA